MSYEKPIELRTKNKIIFYDLFVANMGSGLLSILLFVNIGVVSMLLFKVSTLVSGIDETRETINTVVDTLSTLSTIATGNIVDKIQLIKRGAQRLNSINSPNITSIKTKLLSWTK